MKPQSRHELTERIVEFLREIGLKAQSHAIVGETVLPGIKVDQGVLLYDPSQLQFPGDLLHEAGHLAVKAPADRQRAGMDLGDDPAEEMMAIGWSYAAALHLQLPPEVVFHPAGYQGGSKALLDNFASARFLAVPLLQWLGLTQDEKQARESGGAAYPIMRAWLRAA